MNELTVDFTQTAPDTVAPEEFEEFIATAATIKGLTL